MLHNEYKVYKTKKHSIESKWKDERDNSIILNITKHLRIIFISLAPFCNIIMNHISPMHNLIDYLNFKIDACPKRGLVLQFWHFGKFSF